MIDLSMISYIGVQGKEGDQKTTDFMCKICDDIATKIKFNEIILLTTEYPSFVPSAVRIVKISPLTYAQYNELAFKHLYKWIKSDYMITFHDDGFILNPDLWNKDFLNYDYIGAPWPPEKCCWVKPGTEIGNGGFSFRSKKLYQECEKLNMLQGANEDWVICAYYRDYLISKGIKFAPLEQGKKFSVEQKIDENHNMKNCFGFHGKDHLNEFLKLLE